MSYFADVIVPINLKQLLTYEIPKDIYNECRLGVRIAVPIGKKKLYTAVIVNIHQNKPLHYEAKPIIEILDPYPILQAHQLKLFQWIKKYYLSSYSEILKACLPNALLIQSETLIELNHDHDFKTLDLTDDEYILLEALEKHSQIKLSDVQKILGKTSALKIVDVLVEKNIIIIDKRVKHNYKPKLVKYVKLNEIYINETNLKDLLDKLNRAERQKEIVFMLFQLMAKSSKPISKQRLKKQGISESAYNSLIDKDVLEEFFIQEDRIQYQGQTYKKSIELSADQKKAYEHIKSVLKHKNIVLFKGVTSSGKTEIYLNLIAEYLKDNNQILYLLPEIALTTQLIKRIQNQFGSKVLVYHSKYSANERVETYKNILHANESQVVVGTRSAVFLPFKHLQLIVIDESHENSYKQFDPSPRYHARDTAIVLAQIHQAQVILGSATPSLESTYNVEQGKYEFVELTKRYAGIKPPKISTIDLKENYKRKKMSGHFSDELIDKIKETLSKGKQIILFQNRRGYSPVIECLTCGHTPQCPHCDVSLTLHKSNNTLRCHYCGYRMALQKKCLSCGSHDIDAIGFGTEQIEEEAKQLFGSAVVKRMDLDTTRGKHDFENIISAFENLEIDILIGTQMLSKGLDFRNVELVAVMHADALFHFPNFRAFEKSYQLLTQVAGRAGRTKTQGEVLIQTFQPNHRIIQNVITEDYNAMFTAEMEQRQHFNYPPFYKMIKLTFKSKDYNRLNEAADWMVTYLRQIFKQHVLGPEFPGIARIRNQYIKHIIIKIPPEQSLNKTKTYLLNGVERYDSIGKYRNVRLNIDVDPY